MTEREFERLLKSKREEAFEEGKKEGRKQFDDEVERIGYQETVKKLRDKEIEKENRKLYIRVSRALIEGGYSDEYINKIVPISQDDLDRFREDYKMKQALIKKGISKLYYCIDTKKIRFSVERGYISYSAQSLFMHVEPRGYLRLSSSKDNLMMQYAISKCSSPVILEIDIDVIFDYKFAFLDGESEVKKYFFTVEEIEEFLKPYLTEDIDRFSKFDVLIKETIDLDRFRNIIKTDDQLIYAVDVSNEAHFITCLDKKIKNITLQETVSLDGKSFKVTAVEDEAFEGCTELESIVFSNNINTLGEDLFIGCESLKSIICSNAMKTIDKFTFAYCEALEYIKLPEGLTRIGKSAFIGCEKLKSIHIPETVTRIGPSVFYKCYDLKEANIPNNITRVSRFLFANCLRLEKVDLPDSITEIDEAAFWGCENLKTLRIPKNMTEIEDDAFEYCTNLEIIRV